MSGFDGKLFFCVAGSSLRGALPSGLQSQPSLPSEVAVFAHQGKLPTLHCLCYPYVKASTVDESLPLIGDLSHIKQVKTSGVFCGELCTPP